MADQPETESEGFTSKLSAGRERFLAHVIEHALLIGRRTPEDFIRHFPPEAIMSGLSTKPSIRASILVLTTGLKHKIALRKSWESAAEDLRIALDEVETDAESVVTCFHPDDRVRYLDAQKIWQFLIEGEFWSKTGKGEEARVAKEHVAFMLDRALADNLLTHRDVVEGITVAELARRLPKAELGKIIEGALNKSHDKAPFTEVDLLAEMPPYVLVEHVPLAHIWTAVIEPKIAAAHGYVPVEAAPAEEPESEPETGIMEQTELQTAEAPPSQGNPSAPPRDSDWVELGKSDDEVDEELSEDEYTLQ